MQKWTIHAVTAQPPNNMLPTLTVHLTSWQLDADTARLKKTSSNLTAFCTRNMPTTFSSTYDWVKSVYRQRWVNTSPPFIIVSRWMELHLTPTSLTQLSSTRPGAWHRHEGEIRSVRLSGVVIHSSFRNRGIIYNRQNYVFETHVVIRTLQRIRNLITTDEAKSVVTAVLFLKVRLLKLAVVPHVWCEHSEISARSELTCSSCHWFDLTFVHNTDPCLPPLIAEGSARPLLSRADNVQDTGDRSPGIPVWLDPAQQACKAAEVQSTLWIAWQWI